MKKIIVIIILCSFLASCIQIESDISLENDGSGVITLVYRMSSGIKELGRMGDEVKPCPFPIYKEDFENLLLLYPGLTMKSHSVKEEDGESMVKAVLSFRDVDALIPFGEGENSFSFQKSGNSFIFRQDLPSGIASGEVSEIDEDTMAMLNEYCEGYYVIYTIHTPGPITEYSHGELSKNRKQLTYKEEMIDVLQSKEKQSIEIKWQS
jgi:hypothetical protein